MADKSKSRSGGERVRVSRKTVRRTSAPLALGPDSGDKGGKGGGTGAEKADTPRDAGAAAPPAQSPPAAGDAPVASDAAGDRDAGGGSAGAAPAIAEAPVKAAPVSVAPAAPEPQSGGRPEIEPLLPADALPTVDPTSPAPPPGLAPPGDSRSLRRRQGGGEEFVLIYRDRSSVVTRAGTVGSAGTWSVVEYPSQGAAANSYAQTCSRLIAEGYHDLR